MSEFTIKTLRAVYLQNLPYYYPLPTYDAATGGMYFHPVNTGWQVLPNILWGHFASPRQFYEMVIKYEAIKVIGAKATVFNMIPIQTQLAIQGTTTFNAFNNTIYAWGYKDDLYETPPFNWLNYYKADNQLYTAYKEGAFPSGVYKPGNGSGTGQWNQNLYGNLNDTAWWSEGSAGTPRTSVADPKPKDAQTITLTRQRLPVYMYDFPFNKQYMNAASNNVDNTGLQQMDYYMHDFGGARCSGFTGAFWDPLNRPDQIMELRPGKNAISFSWEAHEADQGHWFNTDAVALQWPYNRDSTYNQRVYDWDTQFPGYNLWTPSVVDPRAAGEAAIDPSVRAAGGTATPQQNKPPFNDNTYRIANMYSTYPLDYQCLPDWSCLPIVPCNWFKKELQNCNPNTDNKYEANRGYTDNVDTKKIKIFEKMWDMAYPGTEYEQYKYPPTQWFMKMVPLFDSSNSLITLEAQVFVQLELFVIGKERKSAIFAPTWGPWPPQNLYSADPSGKFNLSTIRGRSGGARRTWLCNDYPGMTPSNIWTRKTPTADTIVGVVPGPGTQNDNINSKPPLNVHTADQGQTPAWVQITTTSTVSGTDTQTQSPKQK